MSATGLILQQFMNNGVNPNIKKNDYGYTKRSGKILSR